MAAAALLVWSLVRERFEATDSIKAPPYDEGAKIRIYEVANNANQAILRARATALVTVPTTDPTYQAKLQAAAGGLVAPAVGEFFTTVFRPATTPITDANVTTFMATRTSDLKSVEEQVLKAYFVGQQGIGTSMQGGENSYAAALAALGQNAGYLVPGAAAGDGEWESGPPPVCPTGTSFRTIGAGLAADEMEKCYGQEMSGYSCPDGFEATNGSGGGTPGQPCRRVGGSETTAPICPTGTVYTAELNQCEAPPVDPTCPGGYQLREGKCMKRRVAPSTTTGGSTTSMQGPTSGGAANRLRQVFGPQFTERGNQVPPNDGDSSQTNVYPELLGGKVDSSTRIPGAGITAPSKNWQLANNGSLPSKTSMGSDEMSRYFPFSRSPGDMDIIPDPYRVAQTFSTSSYASKTEPAPFLTDFSAFQK